MYAHNYNIPRSSRYVSGHQTFIGNNAHLIDVKIRNLQYIGTPQNLCRPQGTNFTLLCTWHYIIIRFRNGVCKGYACLGVILAEIVLYYIAKHFPDKKQFGNIRISLFRSFWLEYHISPLGTSTLFV